MKTIAPTPLRRSDREEEVRDLLRRSQDGDSRAREALVERFMPLARHLAWRYRSTGEPFDDLVQVASLALLKAVDRFDPAREVAFTSYAVPTIMGELRRHIRDTAWGLHVVRSVKERSSRVESTIADLRMRQGRTPSVGEIAGETGFTEEEVIEAMSAPLSSRTVSLDAPWGADDESGSRVSFLGGEDPALEAVAENSPLHDALADLPERDRKIVHLRFVEDLTQSEIGERVGISQMHVSRVLRATLTQLREQLRATA